MAGSATCLEAVVSYDGMETDHDIVNAVLGNQPGAFARLLGRYQRMVWHIIVRMVHQADDADELAQETFLQVYRNLPQFRFESALSTWIGQVAFSVARRFLAKKRLPIEPADDETDPLDSVAADADLEEGFADAELFQHVATAMAGLSPMQRTILTLFHLDEVPIEEIAQITGSPIGTVKSHLFRARARLRAELHEKAGVCA